MQATRLFPVTQFPHRCLCSRQQILWQQRSSNRFDLVQWARFQCQQQLPRTMAPRTLPLLLHLRNNSNTPQCSPQGRLSHFFSRYHRATSSPPGYKVCALQSLSTHPCLRPLPCVGLRVELHRWSLRVFLRHQRPLLLTRWQVVRC